MRTPSVRRHRETTAPGVSASAAENVIRVNPVPLDGRWADNSSSPDTPPRMSIVLTEFARPRLFPREPRRNTIQDCTPEQFERHLNEVAPLQVLDGYAPFCKLHVHRNWTSTRCLAVPISDDNRALLRSDYEARTKDELPVLVRWFEGLEPPVAAYLVIILYDREQLAKEGTVIGADWGVVGCMYTAEPAETPMAPVTMMRNALGVEEGGSGVPLDRDAYRRSVEFWRTHANWRG
jgi:hypothetical protein